MNNNETKPLILITVPGNETKNMSLVVDKLPFPLPEEMKPKEAWVVGMSIRAIYESYSGKPCPYNSYLADDFIARDFTSWGIVPIIVNPQQFDKLFLGLNNQGQ